MFYISFWLCCWRREWRAVADNFPPNQDDHTAAMGHVGQEDSNNWLSTTEPMDYRRRTQEVCDANEEGHGCFNILNLITRLFILVLWIHNYSKPQHFYVITAGLLLCVSVSVHTGNEGTIGCMGRVSCITIMIRLVKQQIIILINELYCSERKRIQTGLFTASSCQWFHSAWSLHSTFAQESLVFRWANHLVSETLCN